MIANTSLILVSNVNKYCLVCLKSRLREKPAFR